MSDSKSSKPVTPQVRPNTSRLVENSKNIQKPNTTKPTTPSKGK